LGVRITCARLDGHGLGDEPPERTEVHDTLGFPPEAQRARRSEDRMGETNTGDFGGEGCRECGGLFHKVLSGLPDRIKGNAFSATLSNARVRCQTRAGYV
jgi:hypothetical protein